MKSDQKSRRRHWWIVGAVAAAVLILNPYSLLLGAYYIGVPVSKLSPTCRTRVVTMGEHAGFRIGMTEEEAAGVFTARYEFPLVVSDDQWPMTRAELMKVTRPDTEWMVFAKSGCIVQRRHVTLRFVGGTLTRIVDELNVDWI